jgi:hypothetical protein
VVAVVVLQIDQEERDSVVALLGVGLCHQQDEVRPRSVGDERLRARDQVVVAVLHRLGADAGHVGARSRLGDAEAGDLLALDPGDQIALLLLLGAQQVDGGQDHVALHGEAHIRAARARVAHALGANERVVVVATLSAVLLGEAEAQVAKLAGALQRRVGPERLLPLVAMRVELRLHPGLHRLPQIFVLVVEEQVLAGARVLGLDDGFGGCHMFRAPL